MRILAALVLSLTVLTACASEDDGRPSDDAQTEPSPTSSPEPGTQTASPAPDTPVNAAVTRTVVSGLATPWGLDFLPDGTAVVTERDTRRVLVLEDGKTREIGNLSQARPQQEAGLLGVVVSPDFTSDQTLFFYLTTSSDNRIVRATYDGSRLSASTPIVTGIPKASFHDGGRLAFGPDGFLYASTGDAGEGHLAQDPDSLAGKVLRMTADGKPAPGNPGGGLVFSSGHRNVQGLAFDQNAQLWASEFGDKAFDELNRITPGANYGWPEFEGKGGTEGMTDPQVVWKTDEASPSGLAYVEGHLWMASLKGERLWRVTVADDKAWDPTDFFVGEYGRLRTVVVAPNGNLWLTTSNRDGRGDPADADDRILEISLN